MHDTIYEHQDQLDWKHLFLYAKKIGIDLVRLEDDVENNSITKKVEADFESGIRSGVNGTPSFFINGIKYDGDWEEQDLLEYLNSV